MRVPLHRLPRKFHRQSSRHLRHSSLTPAPLAEPSILSPGCAHDHRNSSSAPGSAFPCRTCLGLASTSRRINIFLASPVRGISVSLLPPPSPASPVRRRCQATENLHFQREHLHIEILIRNGVPDSQHRFAHLRLHQIVVGSGNSHIPGICEASADRCTNRTSTRLPRLPNPLVQRIVTFQADHLLAGAHRMFSLRQAKLAYRAALAYGFCGRHIVAPTPSSPG